MAWTFNELHKELQRARNPYIGRPIANNTRVMLINGTLIGAECVGIKLHDTMILRFYPDGSKEVNTGWSSNVTRARIYEFGGVSVHNTKLPNVNGRRPGQENTMCIGHWRSPKAVVFNAVHQFIRIDKDGNIDMETVRPIKIDVIADPLAVARLKRRAENLRRQIELRKKLGMHISGNRNDSHIWIKYNHDKPLEEIDWRNAPETLDTSGKPMWFARMIGAIEQVEIKEVCSS